MQTTTLNKLLGIVQSVAESHAQVNSYYFGEISDLAASEQIDYVCTWVDVESASVNGKTLRVVLDVYVLDIQKDDMANEQDTINDTLMIIQDLYALLTDPTYEDYFVMPYEVSLQTVREGLPDKVNGWKGSFIFELEQTRNRCQVPLA